MKQVLYALSFFGAVAAASVLASGSMAAGSVLGLAWLAIAILVAVSTSAEEPLLRAAVRGAMPGLALLAGLLLVAPEVDLAGLAGGVAIFASPSAIAALLAVLVRRWVTGAPMLGRS